MQISKVVVVQLASLRMDEKFLRWMLCAPEEAHMVHEFEQFCVLKQDSSDAYRHHKDLASFQFRPSLQMMLRNWKKNIGVMDIHLIREIMIWCSSYRTMLWTMLLSNQ